MNKATIRLLVIFLAVLLGSGLLVYLVLERSSRPRVTVDRPAVIATQPDAAESPAETPTPATGSNPLAEIFGPGTASTSPAASDAELTPANIFLKFLIASILAAFLAFRWRSGLTLTKRNPYVAQTQILLAVVAAAMMMVVGDSAARAFGIFAAASLVRFRTNIRDPKETTVLLICLGVGLACGVGRHELAAILTLFSLLTLWTLEHFEAGQIFRTMEVSVGTRNLEHTHQAVKNLFAAHGFNSEVRQLNSEQEGEDGKIVYQLNLGATVSTDRLTEEILAADPQNISSLEWDQKKSSTYIYR